MRLSSPSIAAALLFIVGIGSAEAQGDLRRSGPFARMGGQPCLGGAFSGACDPPPISPEQDGSVAAAAHLDRALRLIGLVRLEAARAAIDAAIKADPRSVPAWLMRGRLASSLHEHEAARAALETARRLAPSDPDVLASLAHVCLQLDRLDEASAFANAAVSLQESDPDARWIRALVRLRLGDARGGEQDLDRSLADPSHRRARQTRAELYSAEGRFAEAAVEWDHLLRSHPSDLDMLAHRIEARLGLNDVAGALSDFASVLGPIGGPPVYLPGDARFWQFAMRRIEFLVRIGRSSDALLDAEHMLATDGLSGRLRLQLHLRQNGFPDIPLDGRRSPAMDQALLSCFSLDACRRGLSRRA